MQLDERVFFCVIFQPTFSYKMKNCFIVLILVLNSCFSMAQESEWKEVVNDGCIKVFSRSVKGRVLKEYRVEATINASSGVIIDALSDIEAYTEWFPNTPKAYRLSSLKFPLVYYVEKDLPWPADNRDLIVGVEIVEMEGGDIVWEMHCLPNELPKEGGRVRTNYMKGHWKISPIGENKCFVYQQVISDPGGYVPDRIANLAIKEIPLRTMKGLISYLEKRKH